MSQNREEVLTSLFCSPQTAISLKGDFVLNFEHRNFPDVVCITHYTQKKKKEKKKK